MENVGRFYGWRSFQNILVTCFLQEKQRVNVRKKRHNRTTVGVLVTGKTSELGGRKASLGALGAGRSVGVFERFFFFKEKTFQNVGKTNIERVPLSEPGHRASV